MIEFKAECGHTVRAKDEDAGGLVRCTYCGQAANVPDCHDDGDVDSLFRDMDDPRGTTTAGPPRRLGRKGGIFSRRRKKPYGFDPFALIAKLCWAAVLISIVFYVGKKHIWPLLAPDGRSAQVADKNGNRESGRKARPSRPPTRSGYGLVTGELPVGLFVSSTPRGADVYCIEASKASNRGRIYRLNGCTEFRAGQPCPRIGDGTYVVEVAFPWDDPRLNGYKDYIEFRRAIENAADTVRTSLVNEYFLPDEASAVFVDETDDQIYIVRQYRNVEVHSGPAKRGVRALFLPQVLNADGVTINMRELVVNYVPRARNYAFDERYVRKELDYYQVPRTDQDYVVEVLTRIGVVPYVTPDGRRTRLFKIGIQDGRFRRRMIREVSE